MRGSTADYAVTSADGILPNLYRKEEAPPVGALRMHAGGISDGEKYFHLHHHRSRAGRKNHLKTVRRG